MSSGEVTRWIWDRDGVRGPNDEVPMENEFVLASDYKVLEDHIANHYTGAATAYIKELEAECGEQAATITRLQDMAVGLAISWAQAWEQTSPDDMAWKEAYDQALRDRHAIVTDGIDAALKEKT